MVQTLTVNLGRPITFCRVLDAAGHHRPTDNDADSPTSPIEARERDDLQAEQHQRLHAIEEQEQNLTRLRQILESIVTKLNDLYQQTVSQNHSDIAKLAVEIARKILAHKVQTGDYNIHAIIEEALKRVPARQALVVHVNPEDLPRCQQLQQEHPDSRFAELNLVADLGIGRAACLIETPKGVVRSFVEEHLDRIAEALEKAQ